MIANALAEIQISLWNASQATSIFIHSPRATLVAIFPWRPSFVSPCVALYTHFTLANELLWRYNRQSIWLLRSISGRWFCNLILRNFPEASQNLIATGSYFTGRSFFRVSIVYQLTDKLTVKQNEGIWKITNENHNIQDYICNGFLQTEENIIYWSQSLP